MSVQSIIMELNILLKVVIISPSLQLTGVLVVVAGVAAYEMKILLMRYSTSLVVYLTGVLLVIPIKVVTSGFGVVISAYNKS